MNNPPLPRGSHRKLGAALILVLCFIVLITGLVVAYFSRTLTTRQLSNASTSSAQAEILAASATDVILSDFRQEIVNGSIAAKPSPAPAPTPATGYLATTVYVPAKAAYVVPQRNAVPTPGPGAPPAGSPIPNLVRSSLHEDVAGGKNAAPFPVSTPGSRASDSASDKPSINGRYISTARWNRHYLLPTATPPPSATPGSLPTPDPSTPVANFTVPDWVFVTAEKGPAVLPANSPFKDAGGSAVTVTGRYAYAVYDEGGLLDINHTGYPAVSLSLPAGVSHIGSKLTPSYADLTQLPAPPSVPPTVPKILTAANVDNLLGWRNYATLQSAGAFPGLQPSASLADTAYYNLFASNLGIATSISPNLLKVPPTVWNKTTDQRFLSRQQLIGYFTAANLDLTYLQYLSTFSRGLNQPSYLPEHSATALLPDPSNPDPAFRPLVLAAASGGNDASGNTGINPNFLAARVLTTFKRYDQTDAIAGEPLVKKRFPLNRLAWLTYLGPSASRDTTATALTGRDGDIGTLKQNGITKEWLDQGTADNIKTYFGLRWEPNPIDPAKPNVPQPRGWVYIHGTGGTNGAILNIDNPAKTIDVVRLGGNLNPPREPDFFELLKAAINPGSIAKASLAPSVLSDPQGNAHAARDQYSLDTSVDIAILQIGVNIIDQFDADGFPTQIHYDLLASGSPVAQLPGVYGDENVPYISRVRSGLIHLVESNPVETIADAGYTDAPTNKIPKPVVDTGVAALMNYPEIWNMHDWSSSTLAQSVGAVAPGKFKIYAKTNTNDGIQQATTVYVANQKGRASCDASVPDSPGYASVYHFSFGTPSSGRGGEARYLSELNTKMTFVIDPTSATSETLFREPTILYKTNFPTGSQLATTALVASNVGTPDGLGYLAMNPTFFGASGGLKSAVDGTNTAYQPLIPTKGAAYIGIYIGAHPLRWYDKNNGSPANSSATQTKFGPVNDVVYTLACEDGNGGWIPYDAKPSTTIGEPNAHLQENVDTGFGFDGTTGLDFGVRYYQTVDPRSTRFGVIDPWVQNNANSIPPRKGYSAINMPEGTIKTDREGVNCGTGWFSTGLEGSPYIGSDWFSAAMGWSHPGTSDPNPDNNKFFHAIRPGMLSQNNPYAMQDGIIATGLLPPGSTSNESLNPFYYADADGVVRRASGGNVGTGAGSPAAPASTIKGLPMAYALGTQSPAYSSGTIARQMDSRPSILNRPFRSVTELGYVYSGTPWKNLDFFLPESGNAALLDVFCVNDNSDSNALTAGQVNLNTHQLPVLQAILAQTSKDQWNDQNTTPTAATNILGTSSGTQAQQFAQLLVNRTVLTGPTIGPSAGAGPQPLQNVSDLVGRWVKKMPVTSGFGGIDGKASHDGFTADLATFLDVAAPTADLPMHNIQRFGESALRALANSGQTRVWNLMFDIVAQTGRYPTQATKLDQFNVEGEQHYWVHVALDRYTGQILDKQVEVVKE